MLITFEDRGYHFDPYAITVPQARVIKHHCGLGFNTWLKAALEEGDPEALQGWYWVMKAQNGENVDIATADFSMLRFWTAVSQAQLEPGDEGFDADPLGSESAPTVDSTETSGDSAAST
jgi:hypothetical protein